MPAISKIDSIESEYGKPMPQVLTDLFEKLGSQRAVAEELGVAQGTVSLWLMRYRLTQKTILVKEEHLA